MRVRRSWFVLALVLITVGGATISYALWLRPPRERLARLRERARVLRAAMSAPWPVALGTRPTREANMVPTRARIRALRGRLHPPPDSRQIDSWKRDGVPPEGLVQQLRRNADARSALAALAEGDHGEATDASGDELDEVMLWMVARAYAEDTGCLDAIVDAVRIAQAIQPVLRVSRDPSGDEMLVLASVEPRLATCSASAAAASRQRTTEALLRLAEAHTWPGSPLLLLRQPNADLEWATTELDRDVFASEYMEWNARVSAAEHALDDAERIFAHRGPRDTLPDDLRFRFGVLSSMLSAEQWDRIETRLFVAALRFHSGQALDDELMLHEGTLSTRELVGCDTIYDGSIRIADAPP